MATITWETTTDWDNAVSEAGVVHEGFGDLPGSDTVLLGYPSFDRGGNSLFAYYPLDEDSGTNANDVANGRDGSVTGATVGASGLHNSTAYSLDGVDDDVNLGDLDIGTNISIVAWVKTSFSGDGTAEGQQWVINKDYDGSVVPYGLMTSTNTTNTLGTGMTFYDGTWRFSGGPDIADGQWHFVCGTYDGSTLRYYVDGSEVSNTSYSATLPSNNQNTYIGLYGNDNAHFDGDLEDIMLFNRTLSASEISALYNSVSNGNLTTSTKTFADDAQPNLRNLSYNLNTQSITIDVIGSPGTASEEIVSQTLGGATEYDLSWTNSHTDFRIQPQLSSSDKTESPTLSSVSLETIQTVSLSETIRAQKN